MFTGSYSYSIQDSGNDSSGGWQNSSEQTASFNWFEQGRGKQLLTSTKQGDIQEDHTSSWSNITGSGGSTDAVTGNYLLQGTYQPGTGSPRWLGSDFDLTVGSIAYSGNSDYEQQSSFPEGSSSVAASSTPAVSGAWSGTSSSNWSFNGESGSSTSSLDSPAWAGGWYYSGWGWWGEITAQTQTSRSFLYQHTLGNYSETSVASESLSSEYTDTAFMADVMADLPDWPEQWEGNWWGWGWYGWGWWGWQGYPWYGWWTAGRDLQPEENLFSIHRMQYRFTASPSIPFTFEWMEVFIPEDDAATPENESESPKVVSNRSWEAPAEGGESPVFEVDPSQREDGDGYYYIAQPTRFSAWRWEEGWLDQNAKKQRGIALSASLQLPPGADENSAERKMLGSAQFWCNASAVPNSEYKFTWQGNAVSLVLDGVFTDGEWGSREIQNGDSVAYGDFIGSSMSFTVFADPKLMTTPFVEIKVTAKDAHGGSLGEDTIKAHFNPELKVDANRDGRMVWPEGTDTDPLGETVALHNADALAASSPYVFWLNDDNDSDNKDHLDTSQKDHADNYIQSERDLEDFTRLWVSFRGLTDLVKSSGVQVRLEWLPENGTEWNAEDGTPAIKVFKAVEADGGTEYLEDSAIATQQASGQFKVGIGQAGKGAPLNFAISAMPQASLAEENPGLELLFEGSSEGKGRLRLSAWKGDVLLAEGGEIRLHIRSVKRLIQRRGLLAAKNQWAYYPFEKMPGEEPKALMFVHGWNMSPSGAESFAETMFKRLWWRGFKGRFAAVRWATYHSAHFDGSNEAEQAIDAYLARYNDSEQIAWRTGPALKQYFNQSLPGGYTKNLVAHSMGNIVAGSALRDGLAPDNYALLNAAVPAACYDDSEAMKETSTETHQIPYLPDPTMWDELTPDDDPDPETRKLAYRGKLKDVSGNLVSFYLPNDIATSFAWECNNDLAKPPYNEALCPLVSGMYYRYERSRQSGKKLFASYPLPVLPTGQTVQVEQPIRNTFEAMAYACRTWGKAAGAKGETAGSIDLSKSVNLSESRFGGDEGFEKQHSAQFERNIQKLTVFYDELLIQLLLKERIPQSQ